MSASLNNITPMLGQQQRAVDRKTAAQFLGVSESTIQREMNRGKLLGFKVGGQWRIMVSDIHKYIENQQARERMRVGA